MRSLRTKLVMIMVILILALMCVIGAFLINGVGNFYISQFYEQMEKTFSPEFIGQLQEIPAQEQNAPERMKELLMAQAGLGIDIATRNVYILDETGNVLASSNQQTSVSMTANLLTAMNGTMRAFFEHGNVTAPRVAMLRKQLLALCRGYLTAATSTNARDSLNSTQGHRIERDNSD